MKNLKTKIHDEEYDKILKGEYSLTEIITEKYLMKIYGVSKSPVREALTQLCSENMLKSIPRCGYQLTQISIKELQDTLQLRSILELGAFDLYKDEIDGAKIEKLEEHVKIGMQLAKEKEVSKHWFHNMAFHDLLCSFTNNQILRESLQSTLSKCSRYAYQYFHLNWDAQKITDSANHKEYIKLFKAGKTIEAKEILKNDIMSFYDDIFK